MFTDQQKDTYLKVLKPVVYKTACALQEVCALYYEMTCDANKEGFQELAGVIATKVWGNRPDKNEPLNRGN